MNEHDWLYHFCCSHSRQAIGRRGFLVPQLRHPTLGCKVIWLTTEASPDRERSGLGMHFTKCDRMGFRYRVDKAEPCHPWLGSLERALAPRHVVNDLERFGDPEHWWITAVPVKAELSVGAALGGEDG